MFLLLRRFQRVAPGMEQGNARERRNSLLAKNVLTKLNSEWDNASVAEHALPQLMVRNLNWFERVLCDSGWLSWVYCMNAAGARLICNMCGTQRLIQAWMGIIFFC